MSTTFELARVGDRVWDIRLGWGVVHHINTNNVYPVAVSFPNGDRLLYTTEGFHDTSHVTQSLFWDEVVIEAPQKPLPKLEVDTKVLVWNSNTIKHKRHFSHFSPTGRIVCFYDGMTSWTTESTTEWEDWELPE